MKTYPVTIGALQRELPLFEVAPGVKIALFDILGDTRVVQEAAAQLVEKISSTVARKIDYFITPEVKSIPLAYELSRVMQIPYIVVRKIKKPYMVGAISSQVTSITTGKPQTLWLHGSDVSKIKSKKVALVDDVVSTGSTFKGLQELVNQVEAQVISKIVIFTEGEKDSWGEVISLGHLPIFRE